MVPATLEMMEELKRLFDERALSRSAASLRKRANYLYQNGVLTTVLAPQIIEELQRISKDSDLKVLIDEIHELLRERQLSKKSPEIRRYANAVIASGDFSEKSEGIIQRLRAIPRDSDVLVPGLYAIDGKAQDTDFYRVGDDNEVTQLYGAPGSWRKEQVTASQSLYVVMTIKVVGLRECAERFGREMGICAMCESPLSNEKSRELGIGPECKKKFKAG